MQNPYIEDFAYDKFEKGMVINMKGNTDCAMVADLMPLSLDGLTSEESEQLIQKHILTCKKCQRYRENLILERQEREKNEQENDKKIFRALKRWRYELIGLFLGVLFVMALVVILLFQPFSSNKNEAEVYPVKEHYEQTVDYGKQDYQGIAGLALFPDSENVTGQIEEFYYDCKGNKLYQEYQIYLECTYEKDAYEAEKHRVLNITDKNTERKVGYSEEETKFPCVYAMLYDEGYEYALLSEEECKVIYIYLQGKDRRELVFDETYLPRDYGQRGDFMETEREPFRIYMTNEEVMRYEP